MKRISPLKLILFLLLLLINQLFASSVTIPYDVQLFNGTTDLPSGTDTIFLATDTITGKRGFLKIKNIQGSASNPIVITHIQNEVFLLDADSHYYAMAFENCHYFSLRATNVLDSFHIKITGGTGTALSLDHFCSDFSIEGIEIYGVPGSGIKAKTHTHCGRSDTRTFPNDSIYPAPNESYVMKNVQIMNNYIHDVGEEGMYIGESFFPKRSDVCGNIYSHEIHDITIRNNKIQHTGWDGIQVGCATIDCEISNNEVLDYGYKHHAWHSSGIQVGHGTGGICSNNWIEYGFGHGIVMNGTGANEVYNNVILQIGKNYVEGSSCALGNPNNPNSATCTDQKDVLAKGIYIDAPDSIFYDTSKTQGYWIYNNTFMGCKSGAITYLVDSTITVASRFNNNLLTDYHFLHNSEKSIEIEEGVVANFCNNYVEEDRTKVGVVNSSYNLLDSLGTNGLTNVEPQVNSILINSGTYFSEMDTIDFKDSIRIYGSRVDIGAYEFIASSSNASLVDCPCQHFIPSETSGFDGKGVEAGDTICILAGHRGILDIENVEGTDNSPVWIINHGGTVYFENSSSHLLDIIHSGNIVLDGDLEKTGDRDIQFSSVGTGTATGVYLDNVNSVLIRNTDFNNLNIGIRYRFDEVDTTLLGHRSFSISDIDLRNIETALYFGYSSGFSGQEAWKLGNVNIENVTIDSANTGLRLYGIDEQDTLHIFNSKFLNIDEHAIKAEQNSMFCQIERNLFKDVGYNALFGKSNYNQPFSFEIQNNVMVRVGNQASDDSDQSIPLFVNFQQKSGSFLVYHNTIVGFDADLAIKSKYCGNTSQSTINNLMMGNNSSNDLIELNGSVPNFVNYENSTLSGDTIYFEDYTNDNFDILFGAPWINDGDSILLLKDDFGGNLRYDSLPDVGAFEYMSAAKASNIQQPDNSEVIQVFSNDNFKWNIYPNPALHEVTIESINQQVDSYQIYDRFYRMVKEENENQKRPAKIDLTGLSEGLYFIRIVSSSNDSIRSFVKL